MSSAMEDQDSAKKRNYFNLVLGLAFAGYGSYRIITYMSGAEYSNFRLIIAVGFIVLGCLDLYKFFRPGK